MMKKKVFSNFIKKSVALVLALAMVVTGLYLAKPEASEVKASGEGVAAADVVATWGTAPETTEEGVIFAGWYADAEYTEPLKDKPASYAEGTVYYPKWVDDDLLSVKMQMQENASGTYNLRLISSVDTLNYKTVGFKIHFKGEVVTWNDYTVMTRINAKNITTKYEFSPAIISPDAEYFFTGTLVDIKAEYFDTEDFWIEPFWTTFDGAEVLGKDRYFALEDGFVKTTGSKAVTNINIPVKMNEPASAESTFTATGITYVAGVEQSVDILGEVEYLHYDGEYAHFNIETTADKATLLGATKITVAEDGKDNSGTAVYRNLAATTMNDTSWYYVDATATDISAKKFVVNTEGEFYGLQSLSTSDNRRFGEKTVVISKNLELNEVEEGTSAAWKAGTATAQNTWTPIAEFRGTLDGNGNTIRGLYIVGSGIFTKLHGFVKDLVIEDGYVANTADNTGVIAGTLAQLYASGTGITYDAGVDTVKVGARVYITSTNGYVGGFAGSATNCTFYNSEFAGNLQAGAANGAGFIGQVLNADDVEIKNCLNTGTIKATNYPGGFVGSVRHNSVGTKSNVTLKNCLNVGTVDVSGSPDRASAIVANLNNTNNTAVLEDVYTTNAVYGSYTSGATVAIGRNGGGTYYGNGGHCVENMNGDNAFASVNLDYWSEANDDALWVASANSYPQLKAFTTLTEDEIQQTHSTGANMQATDWYYSKVQENGTNSSDAYNAGVSITYELETASDVRGFAWLVDNTKDDFAGDTVKLSKSIIMNTVWDGQEDTIATSSVTNWTGIGTGTLVFKGIFDGQNHTLSNLYQNRAGNQGGLFRTLAGTVQNLVISDSFFSVRNNGGSVAGTMTSGRLENVCVEKTVKVSVQTDANYSHHGGLVGLINGSGGVVINNCSFAGDLVGGGTPYGHGGILGTADASCTINGCTFTGTVTSPRSVGGIVGKVRNNNPVVVVTDCVVGGTLSITSDSGRVGSITGATYSGSTLQYSNIDDSACTLIRMGNKITTKKYGNADGTVTNLDAQ